MAKTTRARYTLEFKQEAVRMVESGQSIAAAARALGVVEQTLFNWVKAHRQGKLRSADRIRHHQFNESAWQLLGYACSETLLGSLKVERLHGQRFKTRRHAKDETIAWKLWSNRARLHSTLATSARCSSSKTGLQLSPSKPIHELG